MHRTLQCKITSKAIKSCYISSLFNGEQSIDLKLLDNFRFKVKLTPGTGRRGKGRDINIVTAINLSQHYNRSHVKKTFKSKIFAIVQK